MNEPIYEKKKKHLNPFRDLFEKDANKNARTLRSGFWGKFTDSAKVYLGTKDHLGLFDYLLVIPFLVEKADVWLKKREEGHFYNKEYRALSNVGATLLGILTGILKPIFNLVRYISFYPFMIVSLPFIGIAHLISKIEGDPLKSTIDQWAGIEGMSSDEVKVELISEPEVMHSDHQILVRLKKTQSKGHDQGEQVVEKLLDFDQDQNVFEALTALNLGGKANDLRFFKERLAHESLSETESMDLGSDDLEKESNYEKKR